MRDLVFIYTGQGAAGSFKDIAIYTGQLSTCSPVVMFNEDTCVGGLYHLPGKSGDETKLKNEEWNNLVKLTEYVRPTVIFLYPAGDYSRRQGFIEGTESRIGGIQVTRHDSDLDLPPRQAREVQFDRTYLGDQTQLNGMFARLRSSIALTYDIQLPSEGKGGIQVSADDSGKLSVLSTETSLGGVTYDLRSRRPPAQLCMIVNPDIDYSQWSKSNTAAW